MAALVTGVSTWLVRRRVARQRRLARQERAATRADGAVAEPEKATEAAA
ncbi:MAG: hypothetical protein QOG76_8120, partial [Pseudonocardiales bacterium]|nr:hypothetical protein [Pseudonocardiales bacterium]